MPNEEKVTRKLRAILSADVKGYSLLMADDEALTIQTLKKYRGIMSEYIQQHTGRIVDAPGDNLLAEFSSIVDAVTCAVEIQKTLKVKNEDLPENKRLEFRIGVNIGDVVQDGDRIYGNGVNVAARIEGLAEPGGVSISRNAYDHIRDKLELGYEYLGEHSVKNIKHPVRVYKLLLDSEDAGKLIGKKTPSSPNLWIFLAAVVAVLVLLLIVWQFYQKEPEPIGKPSIAILPFANISDDPEQEYFSDGLTDDIITDLSKISGLLVISRNSTFTFKGKDIKIPKAAKELGVRYVLEGSVRKAGDQVRINAQLIDATTDHHLWAERFDDKYENIFKLQDRITSRIVSALALKLSTSEQHIMAVKGTPNVDAYNAYLKGMGYMRRFTPDDYVKAIGYFKQAIELDRNYSQAYAALAYTYWNTVNGGKNFFDKIGIDYEMGRIFARHYLGLAMKKPTSRAYQLMAFMEQFRRHYKEAIEYAERAVTISPNDADALSDLGFILVWNDNPEAGIKYFKKSIMLDPLHRGSMGLGLAYFSMRDYEKTLKYVDIGISDNPERTPFLAFSAAAHAFLGNEIEANKALNKYLGAFEGEANPSVQLLYYFYPYKNSKVFDRLLEGLVKAGYQADHIGYYKVDGKFKLSGQEIETLVVGKTTTGYVGDYKWSYSPLENGNFVMSVSINGFILSKYIGKAWIEGDSRCFQYENRYEGIKHCSDYFYNPEGEEKTKTEYIAVHDRGISPFSVVE